MSACRAPTSFRSPEAMLQLASAARNSDRPYPEHARSLAAACSCGGNALFAVAGPIAVP
jgi:hypothetical protein